MWCPVLVVDSLVSSIPFCKCATFCIPASVAGHLTRFHFLAILQFNDSVHICVQVLCEHRFSFLLGTGAELSTDLFYLVFHREGASRSQNMNEINLHGCLYGYSQGQEKNHRGFSKYMYCVSVLLLLAFSLRVFLYPSLRREDALLCRTSCLAGPSGCSS